MGAACLYSPFLSTTLQSFLLPPETSNHLISAASKCLVKQSDRACPQVSFLLNLILFLPATGVAMPCKVMSYFQLMCPRRSTNKSYFPMMMSFGQHHNTVTYMSPLPAQLDPVVLSLRVDYKRSC